MATITTGTTLFPSVLSSKVFEAVTGHSSLAKVSARQPIPFAGQDNFVFTMDGEAAVVGEGAAKAAGEADWAPVTVKPIKFVYQHRITEEFIGMSEEQQVPYLQAFVDGFGKKMARALDIGAIHGVNPADGTTSDIIGTNCFVSQITDNTVEYDSDVPDENIDDGVHLVIASDGVVTGTIMSTSFAAAMGSMKTTDGLAIYPEFRFGNVPEAFGGHPVDVNSTVSFVDGVEAITGDFANAFVWGYAQDIPIEVIEYGDPDGLGDLKRYGQVCLKAQASIGWAILRSKSFAMVTSTTA